MWRVSLPSGAATAAAGGCRAVLLRPWLLPDCCQVQAQLCRPSRTLRVALWLRGRGGPHFLVVHSS